MESNGMTNVSRRTFLTGSATAAATATAVSTTSAPTASAAIGAQPVEVPQHPLPFVHGVASGDPMPETVILWTRITPTDEAVPGSGYGPDTKVRWEIATGADFKNIVKSGEATSKAESDHTIHVDPYGLKPTTEYFYRFTVLDGAHKDAVSPVGRTKTAPALDADLDKLKFGVASCANLESGFFAAYGDIAARGRTGELDFLLFLGDYIYEYARGRYSGMGPYRLNEPENEIVTLTDYRTRYGQYRRDNHLQAAHAALPWISVWDDHEVANNDWREGAENHTNLTEGDYQARRNAAWQAYFEWLPVRASNPTQGGHIYRSFTFGTLADFSIMDLRTYRDDDAKALDLIGANDARRTMLGPDQFEWLKGKLETSTTRWNVLGTSVMFSPMNIATIARDPNLEPVMQFLIDHQVGADLALSAHTAAQTGAGVIVNGDQWDGYNAERGRILDILSKHESKVLFCAGDVHSEWAHKVEYQGRTVGAELVCSSITSPNVNDSLKLPEGNPLSKIAEDYLKKANPNVQHVDLDVHGYAVAEIDHDGVNMSFRRVSNLGADDSAVVDGPFSWRWA